MSAPDRLERVHVVGAGLIGTSIGLALTLAEVDVTLTDKDAGTAELAAGRGAGRPLDTGATDAQLIVVAVPPASVPGELRRAARLNPTSTLIDVTSVKSHVLDEIKTDRVAVDRFVGTHPIAGRERGGPMAGRADLFHGRSWVVTVPTAAAPEHVARAERLIELCGGRPVRMSVPEHDAALGLLSHLPQLVASTLAGELAGAPFDVSVLAGQGLRDMTRIAESDPDLWADICVANAEQLAPLLDVVGGRMSDLAAALRGPNGRAAVAGAVAAGQRGRGRLGATHGRPVIPVDIVTVLLSDRPGELARIFTALGDAGVNVDDMRIDHAPGEAVGVLELVVPDGTGPAAVAALDQWTSQVASSTSR